MTPHLVSTRRWPDRLCVAACWGSLLLFVGFAVFGLFDHDVVGAAVVGVLAAVLFADIAVLTANWASEGMRRFAYALWGAMAVVLLGGALLLLKSGRSDADLLLTYGVAILAFPLGLVAGPIAGQFSMTAGLLQTTVIWTLAVGIGCLQWFVLIPMLLRPRKGATAIEARAKR